MSPMVYDLPTVDAQARPSTQFQAPESKNIAAEQSVEMGKAVQTAGVVAMQINNTIAEARAKEADYALSGTLLDLETAYNQKTLKDAVDGLPELIKAAQDKALEIKSGLKDSLSQAMFDGLVKTRMRKFETGVKTYAAGQAKLWNHALDDSRTKNQGTAMKNALAFYGTEKFDAEKANLDTLIRDQIVNHGIPEGSDVYVAKKRELASPYHEDNIATLARIDPAAARTYLTEMTSKDEIVPEKIDAMKTIVDNAESWKVSLDVVDSAWQKKMGDTKDYNAPVKPDELYAAIREDPRVKNKVTYEAAYQEMSRKIAGWNAQQAELNTNAENSAWSMLNGGKSLAQIQASPEWINMGGEAQGRFIQTANNIANAREQRAAAAASRKLTEMRTTDELLFRKNIKSYIQVSNPEILANTTEDQISAMQDLFGAERVMDLLEKKRALGKGGAEGLRVVNADEMVKRSAREAGIIPYGKDIGGLKEDQQVAYAKYEDEIQKRVKIHEATVGRKATLDDLQKIIDGVAKDRVKLGVFSGEKPVSLATPDELKQAYVMVGDRKVYVAKISETDQRDYSAKLKARGYPTTQENIASLWAADHPNDTKPTAPTDLPLY